MKDEDLIHLEYTTLQTPLPDFIYQDLRNFSSKANVYHPQPPELIEKIAKKHNLPNEMIYLCAGVDEAIDAFILAFGQNTYIFTPTYLVYADTKVLGGNLMEISSIMNNDYVINPKKYNNASLIFLANPNNPCGWTEKEKIIELIENNQAIIVIDEAYAEFNNLSVIDLTKKHSHIAVFRTFSKDYSMAGNRIGYIVANPEIIAKVKNKMQWANVSYLSVGAAISALNHEEYFIKQRQDINNRRDEFIKFLNNLGFFVFPSKINGVLLRFENIAKAGRLTANLLKNNIVVNNGNGNSNVGLDKTFVRMAIGTKEQMEKVQQVLKKYVNK